MGQSLGCYLAGISSRFVWLTSFCYYACWIGQSLGCYLVGNLSPNCHLSNLYQTFNVTVKPRAAVSLASRLVLTIFFLLLLHSFTSVQQFFAFQLSRELCFFLWGFSHSCVACGGFLSPHFLFSRLIGLHISMCGDSVSFDFIKPATTVARGCLKRKFSLQIYPTQLFVYNLNSVPYRKVRDRKCKQRSRRVGPCFEHMPWYKTRHYGRHNVIYGKAWY